MVNLRVLIFVIILSVSVYKRSAFAKYILYDEKVPSNNLTQYLGGWTMLSQLVVRPTDNAGPDCQKINIIATMKNTSDMSDYFIVDDMPYRVWSADEIRSRDIFLILMAKSIFRSIEIIPSDPNILIIHERIGERTEAIYSRNLNYTSEILEDYKRNISNYLWSLEYVDKRFCGERNGIGIPTDVQVKQKISGCWNIIMEICSKEPNYKLKCGSISFGNNTNDNFKLKMGGVCSERQNINHTWTVKIFNSQLHVIDKNILHLPSYPLKFLSDINVIAIKEMRHEGCWSVLSHEDHTMMIFMSKLRKHIGITRFDHIAHANCH